ncbi:MAG: glycosyltransferase [Tenericutes bacterium]|nr:glycosyltransferase [Mycoplasmatota bacterium]
MRIGLFTDSYPPYINGVSTSVAMLKKALEKKGHIVYVVTVSNNALKYEYDVENRIVKVPGIPVGIYDYRLSRIYPLTMINTMKSWNLDVIHSHTEFGIGILARLLAKQFDIPLVHTYHTLYEDYTHYITHGYFDKSSKKIVEYLTKFYCDKTANELIVPTNKIYKLFKEKYEFKKNIHIVPTGIEVDRFYTENVDKSYVQALRKKLKLQKKDFVILFVGRLAAEKNVEFLLNAEKKLMAKYKNIKLLIVGDGPDKEHYEEMARDLNISSNVIFNGKAAWEEMPFYYHCANVFATASTTETQGLTVIEAMAASVVPLCIKDESFLGTVTHELNGLIFNDEDEFVNQVLTLYKDNALLQKYNNQARIQAEHCSSTSYAERVLEVYKRAILDKKAEDRFGLISKISKKIKGE